MAVTVEEASARFANFMINPAPPGDRICPDCRGVPSEGYTRCYGCSSNPSHLDALVPITYSVNLGQMHTELRGYKETTYIAPARQRFQVGLTAVLWRFLMLHEPCVARAAGVADFTRVVPVPSNTKARDERPGGLRTIVGEMCGHTRDRFVRALLPTDRGQTARLFDPDRFEATMSLKGDHILLIDDTWTTGSRAQSAAYTLREAGAKTVACVVIGRHVRREFADTDDTLNALPAWDWETCAVHGA